MESNRAIFEQGLHFFDSNKGYFACTAAFITRFLLRVNQYLWFVDDFIFSFDSFGSVLKR